MEKVTVALGLLPDFESKAGGIEYIHRCAGDADIYFVSNPCNRTVAIEAVFRTSGKRPELWHPDTGRMETAGEYRVTDDGRTAVTLDLDPAGSVFVVFVPANVVPPGGRGSVRAQTAGVPDAVDIPGPWKVSFQPGRGAPESIELAGLADLSKHSDPGVKYFSGNATYRTHFDFKPETRNLKPETVLDLGNVQVIASVRLNGKDLGIAWKPPFQVEADGALRPGRNELEIVVANLWVNRLIGDRLEPDDCEWTARTGSTAPGQGLARIPDWILQGGPRPSPQRVAFAAWRWPHLAKKQPLPSGLLGPVRLVFEARSP